MNNIVAIGRIQGGRSTIVVATESRIIGKSTPVIRKEVPKVNEVTIIPEPLVFVEKEELDVPSFMKDRKPAPKEEKVIHVDFGNKEEVGLGEDFRSVKLFKAALRGTRRRIEETSVFKYFFGEEEDRY